jgi:hypothetical protein
MSALGNKRTNHRGPKSTVVRYYSNSGQILQRNEMTLSAMSDQRTAANSIPIQSRRQQGRAASAAQ